MAEKRIGRDVPEVDLSTYTIDQKAVSIVPASLAEKYKLIPLFKVGNTLTIAMADPKNIVAVDEVRTVSNMDVSVVKSSLEGIKIAVSENYGISALVEDVVKGYRTPDQKQAGAKQKIASVADAPIVKLVDAVISQAVLETASDIHIEPETKHVRVRYRVDGILHEELTMPSFMLGPVVSRIKVLSGMNIAESRVPQDGRFEANLDGKAIDFRVSTFPSAHGEKVVMRILDKSKMVYDLKEIGFSKENFDKFEKIVHKPHGIILVTGPTGSGKSTTLYAALMELDRKELNIMTVEDPIEYEIDGITQSQVNVKAGLTFATALRSMLRQDPDVILVGEIRDVETASIAIQSAMTGHVVFSTLHTNDSAGAITRLIDMGIEPFLICSSVEAVLAQRLVRTICPKCKIEINPVAEVAARYPELKVMYKGKGCKSCKLTGFKGRTGIYELLVLDEKVRKMIAEKTSSEEIRKYAVSCGMKTLFEDGMEKVKNGITTMDEIVRVTELEQV